MTIKQILETCRKRGWITRQNQYGWWRITPLSMREPQGVCARTLKKAYEICCAWEEYEE